MRSFNHSIIHSLTHSLTPPYRTPYAATLSVNEVSEEHAQRCVEEKDKVGSNEDRKERLRVRWRDASAPVLTTKSGVHSRTHTVTHLTLAGHSRPCWLEVKELDVHFVAVKQMLKNHVPEARGVAAAYSASLFGSSEDDLANRLAHLQHVVVVEEACVVAFDTTLQDAQKHPSAEMSQPHRKLDVGAHHIVLGIAHHTTAGSTRGGRWDKKSAHTQNLGPKHSWVGNVAVPKDALSARPTSRSTWVVSLQRNDTHTHLLVKHLLKLVLSILKHAKNSTLGFTRNTPFSDITLTDGGRNATVVAVARGRDLVCGGDLAVSHVDWN